MKPAVRVAVTGAAGQISYSLLFRIAHGDMLGPDQPVILQLLELPQALPALQGVVMELMDCAFPLLESIVVTDKPEVAFEGADYALLVGARPRSKGMERSDLLAANAAIFSVQGRALDQHASKEVKVLVVGNPANTNALITIHHAPSLKPTQIHAMMRLDHNRALAQIAAELKQPIAKVKNVIIWGNHSALQYPDLFHATADGKSVASQVEMSWVEQNFIPTVQKRGAAIIEARGASSAASAANAAIDHMRNWVLGTAPGEWVSMGIFAEGAYGVQDVVFGYPCTCQEGVAQIVEDLTLNDFGRPRFDKSYQELMEERDAVAHLWGDQSI